MINEQSYFIRVRCGSPDPFRCLLSSTPEAFPGGDGHYLSLPSGGPAVGHGIEKELSKVAERIEILKDCGNLGLNLHYCVKSKSGNLKSYISNNLKTCFVISKRQKGNRCGGVGGAHSGSFPFSWSVDHQIQTLQGMKGMGALNKGIPVFISKVKLWPWKNFPVMFMPLAILTSYLSGLFRDRLTLDKKLMSLKRSKTKPNSTFKKRPKTDRRNLRKSTGREFQAYATTTLAISSRINSLQYITIL